MRQRGGGGVRLFVSGSRAFLLRHQCAGRSWSRRRPRCHRLGHGRLKKIELDRLDVRRGGAPAGAGGGDGKGDIGPVLAGALGHRSAAHQLQHRLFGHRAGIQPRVIKRTPAGTGNAVGQPHLALQRLARLQRHGHLARWLATRHTALAGKLQRPDFLVKRGDFVTGEADVLIDPGEACAHRLPGGVPLRHIHRGLFRHQLFRPHLGKTLHHAALGLQRGEAGGSGGAILAQQLDPGIGRRVGQRDIRRGQARFNRTDAKLAACLALNAQGRNVKIDWQRLEHEGRRAGGQVNFGNPRHRRRVRIDGDGVNL